MPICRVDPIYGKRSALKCIMNALCLCGFLVVAVVRVSSAVECVGEGESECQPVSKQCRDDHYNEWVSPGANLM